MAAVLLGQSASLLREGFPDWDGAAEVGVVAGNVPHGLGAFFAGFADTHSAAVSVAALVHEQRITAPMSVIPILAAMTANTFTKAILAIGAGGRTFALYVIPGLILLVVAAWAGAFLAGPVPFRTA